MDKTAVSITAMISFVSLCAIIAIIYGCTSSSTRYYNLAHECTTSGGTFIPTGTTGDHAAICLSPRDTMAK